MLCLYVGDDFGRIDVPVPIISPIARFPFLLVVNAWKLRQAITGADKCRRDKWFGYEESSPCPSRGMSDRRHPAPSGFERAGIGADDGGQGREAVRRDHGQEKRVTPHEEHDASGLSAQLMRQVQW